jgi:hypothetical protein
MRGKGEQKRMLNHKKAGIPNKKRLRHAEIHPDRAAISAISPLRHLLILFRNWY